MIRSTKKRLRWVTAMALLGTGTIGLAQGSEPAISLWLQSGGADTETARYCALTDPTVVEWFNQYQQAATGPRDQTFKARKATQYFRSMCNCGVRRGGVRGRPRLRSEVPECALSDR